MLAGLTMAAVLAVAVPAIPPAPTSRVEDHAGLIAAGTRESLDDKLEAYERATGHQLVVWIGVSLDGAPLDDWAVRTFAAWKLGRAGHDDGIAMFVLARDRAVDIEVGYGLEDRVPDAVAARIIREVMVPRLRAGDADGAIVAGTDAVLSAIEGRPWTGSGGRPPPWRPSALDLVGGALFAALMVYLIVRHPRAALGLFWLMMRAGRAGGVGRRGFGGGGGRSGGGGARGHW